MKRLPDLPTEEYDRRIQALQMELQKENVDLLIGYSSESESGTARYLTGFWPFFDFTGVVVPVEGKACLVTGGPESYEFAKSFSRVADICINPLFVETFAPEWVPQVRAESFARILPRLYAKSVKRIGIANWNIFPHTILDDVKMAYPGAELVNADRILLAVQAFKSPAEIPLIVEAYRITEEAMKEAISRVSIGMCEWQLEALARSTMHALGAEGTAYPIWVCSGANTRQSLCRSTDKPIQKNELIQLTFGAKYKGYCGNMCRVLAIGRMPPAAKRLADIALEASQQTIGSLVPGAWSRDLYKLYHSTLERYHLEDFTLYGPAHGTGSSEVEGLWLSKSSDFEIRPNMLFNVDIWLSEGGYGVRLEDGLLVTETGNKQLTTYRREVVEL